MLNCTEINMDPKLKTEYFPYLIALVLLLHIFCAFQCAGMNAKRFQKNKNMYLNVTTKQVFLVNKMSLCALQCTKEPMAFSFNFALQAEPCGRFICEVLHTDRYNDSDKYSQSDQFHHYSMFSLCFSDPCQNNGTCEARYADNIFTCHCLNGTSGVHCQKVAGGWTGWSAWSSCSKSCDPGTKSRTRTCTNPPPQYGGAMCTGRPSETVACNLVNCTFNLFIRSEGCDDRGITGCGHAFIKVDNVEYSPKGRGHNFVVLNRNGAFINSKNFDASGNSQLDTGMKTFINAIPAKSIVLISVQDTGTFDDGTKPFYADAEFRSLGGVNPILPLFREAWYLIGYKGSPKPAWVKQDGASRYNGPVEKTITIEKLW